jgi:hypothetical protein
VKFNRDSYLVAADSNLPHQNSPRSISFWAKREGETYVLENTNGKKYRTGVLLNYGNSGTVGDFGSVFIEMWSELNGLDHWGARYVGNADAYLHWESQDKDADWIHVCYVFVEGILRCYVNAVLIGSVEKPEFHPNQAGYLYIGSAGPESIGKGFPGYMDDLRIYNRALDAYEVELLYEYESQKTLWASVEFELSGDLINQTGRYSVIRGNFTWKEAKEDAESRGGHLATVTTQTEYDAIQDLLKGGGTDAWLGASDEEQEGVWKWVTGEPFAFDQWGNEEPNDLNGEDFLVMSKYGHWNDLPNDTKGAFPTLVAGYVLERKGSFPVLEAQEPQVLVFSEDSRFPLAGLDSVDLKIGQQPRLTFSSSLIEERGDFTFTAWVKIRNLSELGTIVAGPGTESLMVTPEGLKLYPHNAGAGQFMLGEYTFNTMEWYKIDLSRYLGNYYLYVNDTLIASEWNRSDLDDGQLTGLTRLGYNGLGNHLYDFDGWLDEVKYWPFAKSNPALSDMQFKSVHNLDFEFQFENGLEDSSGKGHHLISDNLRLEPVYSTIGSPAGQQLNHAMKIDEFGSGTAYGNHEWVDAYRTRTLMFWVQNDYIMGHEPHSDHNVRTILGAGRQQENHAPHAELNLGFGGSRIQWLSLSTWNRNQDGNWGNILVPMKDGVGTRPLHTDWNHIAITWQAIDDKWADFVFYLNGEEVGQETGYLPLGNFTDHRNESYMTLGRVTDPDRISEFNGFIDGIEMYESVLPVESIQQRYRSYQGDFPEVTLPRLKVEAGYQEIEPGQTIQLGADIQSDVPYAVQWFHNGVLLPEEHENSLTIENFSQASEGVYEQVVENIYGINKAELVLALVSDNLIKNPSFEFGYNIFAPHYSQVYAWRGGSGTVRSDGPFHNVGTPIPDQRQVAFIQGGSNYIAQDISGLETGQNYRLQFYYDARNCCGENRRLDFQVSYGDQLLVSFDDVQPANPEDGYYFYSIDFSPVNASGELRFDVGGVGYVSLLLDAVSLVKAHPTSVVLSNAGFEASGRNFINSFDENSLLAGWTFHGLVEILGANDFQQRNLFSGSHDALLLKLSDGAFIEQKVEGLIPGFHYYLHFYAGVDSGQNGELAVFLDDESILNQVLTFNSDPFQKSAIVVKFEATDTSHLLRFASTKAEVYVNNISIFPNESQNAVDSDGDGLSDEREQELGTNPNNPDSDGDGLSDGWESGTERYSVSEGRYYWLDAFHEAGKTPHGHLATITSSFEQFNVEKIIRVYGNDLNEDFSRPGYHLWLGASDAEQEGEWTWVTGEPFVFSNWSGGEPNNREDEDYLGTFFSLTWNDFKDDIRNYSFTDEHGQGFEGKRRFLLEIGYPSDPNNPDTDGDGYNDLQEYENDTDPNLPDLPRVEISPRSAWGFAGEEIIVPFEVSNFHSVSGVQLSLKWNPDIMTLIVDDSSGQPLPVVSESATFPFNGLNFPMIGASNFAIQGPGSVSMLWDEILQPEQGRSLADGTIFFALHFKLAATPGAVTELEVVDEPTPFKIVRSDEPETNEFSRPGLIEIGDKVPPQIALLGDANLHQEAGYPFTDPGVEVVDVVDGMLEYVVSGSVDVEVPGIYTLVYSAADRFGNRTVVQRTVEVSDTIAPEIELIGLAQIFHPMSMAYLDPGASATDVFDGQVEVLTTGEVDINQAGSYTLRYTAEDNAGNTAEVQRVVNVVPAVSVIPQSITGAPGSQVTVAFKVFNFEQVSGFQFSLNWDPEIMKPVTDPENTNQIQPVDVAVIDVGGFDFPMLGMHSFSINGQGSLSMLWDEPVKPDEGRSLPDGTILFALPFELIGSPGSSTTLEITGEPTPFKIVSALEFDVLEVSTPATIEILNTISIEGQVKYGGEDQKPMGGVTVTLRADEEVYNQVTDQQGSYSFEIVPASIYHLSAKLASEKLVSNGVDVSDIVAVRKHILNRSKLIGVPHLIGGDPNRDGSIDVADIVGMRKLILNRFTFYSADASGNPEDLFRFVGGDYATTSEEQMADALPQLETLTFDSLQGNLSGIDFVGIKLGDVNGDWAPPAGGGSTLNAMAVGTPQSQGNATIGFGSSWSDENGVVHVALNASASQALMGLELEISWDKDMLELEGMSSDALSHFIPGVHSHEGNASVKVAWDDATLTGTTLNANDPVMTYRFRRVGEGSTGLFLEQALLAGEDGVLGRMQSASLFLGSGNRSRAGLNGAIKSIEHRDNQIELWVDTRGASSWQLESSPTLEDSQWQPLEVLDGAQAWQQVVIPHTEETHFLRLVPVTGPEL